jgi:hypothetical protein
VKISHARLAGGAAIALVMGGTATTLASVASAGTTNLIPNPGFEQDVSGWVVKNDADATLTQVSGGHSGSYSAQVGSPTAGSPALTVSPAAATMVAKATYSAGIWVRSTSINVRLVLRLREMSGGSMLNKSTIGITLHDSAWHQVTTSITAQSSGTTLQYDVIGSSFSAGQAFQADDATLTSTAPAASTPSPTVTATPTPTTSPTSTPTTTPTSSSPTPTATPSSSSTTTSAPSPSTSPTPTSSTSSSTTSSSPPPSGGYFSLVPAGKFSSLPTDAQAAAMVHRSSWEPRPQNYTANHTVPPAGYVTLGYSGMQNHAAVFGRVTGNFTGTTDEIIQWAAAKWGLPDEVIRGEAVDESNWYQNLKTSSGAPINGDGYGDFGSCGGQGSPPPSGYGTSGPSSFGLLQTKWCTLKDASASGYGGWPYTENSTAYELDLYAAVIRGCYEGWDTWLGGSYHSGDLWGCLGRWFSGQWYSTDANSYISRVQNFYNTKPWLTWQG